METGNHAGTQASNKASKQARVQVMYTQVQSYHAQIHNLVMVVLKRQLYISEQATSC